MIVNQIQSSSIRLGEKLSFQVTSGIDKYLLDGWSGQEPNHRWTDGGCARLQFHLSELAVHGIILRVECLGFLAGGKLDHQSVDVLVNDSKVTTWTVRQIEWYEATIPRELMNNGDINISFLVSNPTAPCDVNLSKDKRRLGLRVRSVEIVESGDAPASIITVNDPDKKTVTKPTRRKGRRRKR
jgi:hypothetical protein